MRILKWRRGSALTAIVLLLLTAAGCGNLTDKDLIVVAKLDGESIRRGDLRKLIRDMDDDRRPVIHNRADLLRVLNRYIDDTILEQVATDLHKEGKIDVPREQAMAVHFARNPQDRVIHDVQNAEQLQHEDFDISSGQLAAFQADIEFKIDRVQDELLRDAALTYLIQDAVRTGRMTITDEEFQQEYDVFKDRLFFYEKVGFVGVRFIAKAQNAAQKAAECREELDRGRTFEELLGFYHSVDPSLVFESTIYNDPGLPRFQGFWEQVSGKKVGDVVGPIYVPAYGFAQKQEDGTSKNVTMPAAYMVIQITDREEPRQKNLEESKPDLAPLILRRKMMKQLRDEHGVEVYENKLPDPGRYDREQSSPFVDAGY